MKTEFHCLLSRTFDDSADSSALPILIEAGHHGAAETWTDRRPYAHSRMQQVNFFTISELNAAIAWWRCWLQADLFLQCIFGAWAAGAVIAVLAPTIDGGRSSLSLDRLAECGRCCSAPQHWIARS